MPVELDSSGARRLSVRETWCWYVVAGVTYCAVAVREKFILNWLMGPAWLVLVVWWGPRLWDRVRGRASR